MFKAILMLFFAIKIILFKYLFKKKLHRCNILRNYSRISIIIPQGNLCIFLKKKQKKTQALSQMGFSGVTKGIWARNVSIKKYTALAGNAVVCQPLFVL